MDGIENDLKMLWKEGVCRRLRRYKRKVLMEAKARKI